MGMSARKICVCIKFSSWEILMQFLPQVKFTSKEYGKDIIWKKMLYSVPSPFRWRWDAKCNNKFQKGRGTTDKYNKMKVFISLSLGRSCSPLGKTRERNSSLTNVHLIDQVRNVEINRKPLMSWTSWWDSSGASTEINTVMMTFCPQL